MGKDLIAELKTRAEKATQEPWDTLQCYGENENYVGPEKWAEMGQAVCICRYEKDARFIAAANPQAVLALITEVERLEAIVNGYKVSTEEAQEIMGELQAENARLKEENARLVEINTRMEQEGLFYAGRL